MMGIRVETETAITLGPVIRLETFWSRWKAYDKGLLMGSWGLPSEMVQI